MNTATTTPPRSNWPVNILAAMMFLIPAVGVPNEYMLQDTLKSAIAAFGILLAALAWTWDLQKNPRPIQWHWIVFLPLALCLYALGSMVWSHTYLASVEAIRWFLVSLLIVVLQNTLLGSNVRSLQWGIHGGICAAALWAALQFWFDFQGFPQVALPASTFINRNFYAEVAVSTLPFSLLLLANCRKILQALGVGISISLLVTSILMTGTRSALVAMPIVLGVSVVILWRCRMQLELGRWHRRTRVLALAFTLLGVLVMGNVTGSNAQPGGGRTAFDVSLARSASAIGAALGNSDSSLSVRYEMWKSAVRLLADNAWLGVGAGAFEANVVRYQNTDTDDELDPYAHNEYLQLLGEYGLITGGAVLAVFGAFFTQLAQSVLTTNKVTSTTTPLVGMAFASLLALVLVSGVGFPLHLAGGTTLLGLAIGIVSLSHPSLAHLRLPRRYATGALVGVMVCFVISCALIAGATYVEAQYVRLMYAINKSKALDDLERVRLARALHWNPHYKKLQLPIVSRLAVMGEWAAAKEVLEAMTISRPYSPDTWFSLAMLYTNLNQLEQAQAALNILNQLQPNTVRNFKVLAQILYRQGKANESLVLVESILANWPPEIPPDAGLIQMRSELLMRTPQ